MAANELYKEAQRRLIGSLLYDGEGVNKVLEIVTAEDFEEPDLQIIFESIVNVSRVSEDVNLISVSKDLDFLGMLSKIGGAAAMYSLRSKGERWRIEAQPALYASIVKEYSAKYRMKNVLEEHEKLFKPDSGATAAEVISQLQGELNLELYKLSDESTVSELAGSMEEYFAILAERYERSKENENGAAAGLQGIPSLLPKLNEYTSGWMPGQLITVGARTGVGKTIFAINSAVAAAKAGKSVLFFSLEMGDQELKDRVISSMTGIFTNHLKKGALTPEDKKILEEARPEIDQMRLLFDTDPKVTIDSIRARSLRRAQSEAGLDFIIVDYLQLITPSGRFSSRQEAVADLSRNMKLLAKQLQVPIMVLVQVNRAGKDDEENNIPRLDNIRESGAVAQDSDLVILLHREQSMDDTIPNTLVILAKNRNGVAEKTIVCHSNLECSLFREIQRARDVEGTITDEDIAALDSAYENDDDLSLDDFGEDF